MEECLHLRPTIPGEQVSCPHALDSKRAAVQHPLVRDGVEAVENVHRVVPIDVDQPDRIGPRVDVDAVHHEVATVLLRVGGVLLASLGRDELVEPELRVRLARQAQVRARHEALRPLVLRARDGRRGLLPRPPRVACSSTRSTGHARSSRRARQPLKERRAGLDCGLQARDEPRLEPALIQPAPLQLPLELLDLESPAAAHRRWPRLRQILRERVK
mmetsp:Transcript_42196/g.140278  ORF Transcript_42196/g.140278 Transcript_42196/m.140278 type:complete len:216 (-) Transcript_42196:312-959(-)